MSSKILNPKSQNVGSQNEYISTVVKQGNTSLYTQLPCKVEAYDAESNTATISFGSKQAIYGSKSDILYEDMPNLEEVPVAYSRGSNLTITLPIVAGTEGVVYFGHKCWSEFRRTGKAGNPAHLNNGDIQDVWFEPKSLSVPNMAELKTISTNSVQIRKTEDTNSFIEYNGGSDTTIIKANDKTTATFKPNDIQIKVGDNTTATFKTDEINLTQGQASIDIKGGKITMNAPQGIVMNTPQAQVAGVITASGSANSAGFPSISSFGTDLDMGNNKLTNVDTINGVPPVHNHGAGSLTAPNGAVTGNTGDPN